MNLVTQESRIILVDRWISRIEYQYPNVYDHDFLYENGSVLFALFDEDTITPPVYTAIDNFCAVHINTEMPFERLLHLLQLWREVLAEFIEEQLINEVACGSELNNQLRTLQTVHEKSERMFCKVYWQQAVAYFSQKERLGVCEQSERLALLGKILESMEKKLRNPLVTIEGSILLISKELWSQPRHSEKIQYYIDMIQAEFKDLYAQITKLLYLARNTGIEEAYELSHAARIINEAVQCFTSEVSQAISIEINLRCDSELFIQKIALQQVLVSLLKYSISGALTMGCPQKIIIDTYQDNDFTYIEISGSGGEIREESPNCASSFVQAEKAVQSQCDLAVCKRIVERNKGRFQLVSKENNNAFVLVFPRLNHVVSLPQSELSRSNLF